VLPQEPDAGTSPTKPAAPTPNPPETMRLLIDNKEIVIGSVAQILTETAEYLVRHHLLRPEDCPIQITSGTGASRYLINTQPRHKNGAHFMRPRRISSGLYVETHCNREASMQYAARLLHRFIPKAVLKVES